MTSSVSDVSPPPAAPAPPSGLCVLRASRALQDRLSEVGRLLGLRVPGGALEAWRQCADIGRTAEQTAHLAAVAFNAGVELARAPPGGAGEAAPWFEGCLQMAREVGDVGLADRCLLFLARYWMSVREDPGRAARCLDLLHGDSFDARLVGLLVAKKGQDAARGLAAQLEATIEAFPPDLRQVEVLLCAVGGEDSALSVRLLESAFDRCGAEGDRSELYGLSFRHCIGSCRVRETDELVQDYVSWACVRKGKAFDRRAYEKIAKLCHRHVRRLVSCQIFDSVASCCRALVYLCNEVKDERGKRCFLWHYVDALIRLDQAQEAEKAIRLYAIRPLSEQEDNVFLPLYLELAVKRQDISTIECLVSGEGCKVESSIVRSSLLCILGKFFFHTSPDTLLSLTRTLLASESFLARDENPIAALLAEVTLCLHMKKGRSETEEGKNRNDMLQASIVVVRDHQRSLARFSDMDWVVRVLWNQALMVGSNSVRFAALSLVRKLLPSDEKDDRSMCCLLLQLASGVAALEEERAATGVREEMSELMACCLKVISGEAPPRQRRLLAIYMAKLTLLVEERFSSLARVMTEILEHPGNDGRTLMLVARIMENAEGSRKTCPSYGKLVCRVYRCLVG